MKEFYHELIEIIKDKKPNKQQLNKLKIKLCNKYKLKRIPTDVEVLIHSKKEDKLKLITKPTRTLSGVAVIAIMTSPKKCPHGKCIYCPGGPGSYFGDIPQSYTGNEPATMRAIRNKYDPYLQIFNRLEQYILLGHLPEKIELIIMGGTFPSYDKKYRDNFIKYSFKALNDFSKMFFKKDEVLIDKFKKFFELPGEVANKKRVKKIHRKLLKLKGTCSLEKEQKKNESAKIRCVGLTIETRPDYGMLKEGNEMLKLGCTRVELGIQTTDNRILKKIERGHAVENSIKSTRILKDLGFKINYHVMPGLPGSNIKKDLKMLKELFEKQEFRPDMLKIYPCMVMKGTKLFNLWKKGKYKPITTKHAASLIAEFKRYVPEYCRIMRVQRDIPTKVTEAGVDRTNLRQYVSEQLKKENIKCRCIRCREIGIASKKGEIKTEKIKLKILSYEASQGQEFFISAVYPKQDLLLGFCRLRFSSQQLRKEITSDTGLIRELHVYGKLTEIGKKGSIQHKGLGKRLLKEAERISKENNKKKKIVVISGVGVRNYYKKLGYKKEGPYMVKKLC